MPLHDISHRAIELLPYKLALVLILGIAAQWLAWRLRWPAIVLMGLAGMIFGLGLGILAHMMPTETTKFFVKALRLVPERDFGFLLRPAIALAVAIILFEGGLNLRFADLRDASVPVRRMIFLGAPVGWVFGSLAAHYAGGLSWDLSILLGGLLVVTGPTVIMPLLRQARLKGRTANLLKWEGIVNDPVGALFAVAAFETIRLTTLGESWETGLIKLVLAAFGGIFVGLGAGIGLARAFRHGYVPEYLKAPLILATVLAAYITGEFFERETGLVAATALGVTLANARLASIVEMRRFKESIAIILVSGVFVALAASITPDMLKRFDLKVWLFVGVMMVLVRPLTVFLSTLGSGLSWRETLLVGWIAPRGVVAVAIAGFFATELVALGRSDGEALVPLTFGMVFATVLLHGFTITPLAKILGLSAPSENGVLMVGATPWSLGFAKALQDTGFPVILADSNWRRLRTARLEGYDVYFGEILSEAADHRLDHTRFNDLIAVTPNDAYNALACTEFAPELGRHRVFQLSIQEKDEADPNTIAFTSRGRTLGSRGRSYDVLNHDWWRGWRFRTTQLTEDYTLQDYFDQRGDGFDLFAEKRPDGSLHFTGPSSPPKGGAGSVLLGFFPPKPQKPDNHET